MASEPLEIPCMSAPRTILITSSAQLKECAGKLAGATQYSLDTEFDFVGPAKKLCLVQVWSGSGEIYLIDPVALTVLEPLAAAISRPGVEWIVHAGDQDVALLREALHLANSPRVFDTQVAWGLQGPEYPVSLAYLLYRILGIRSSKSEQAGPWGTRPLTPEQLDYAASDVAHLPALRDWLAKRLGDLGREALAAEVSVETVSPLAAPPLSLDDFRNAWQLDAPGQAVLQHLIEWWNGLSPAEQKEGPQPKIFLTLAKMIPETGEELAKIRGIYFPWAKRHGDAFTGRLVRVSAEASRQGSVPLEPPPYNTFERILAEGWIRKVAAEVSAEAGLAPELAFPERLIRKMIQAVEETKTRASAAELLTGWRERLLRQPFLARTQG
jgi:ribonuclease D